MFLDQREALRRRSHASKCSSVIDLHRRLHLIFFSVSCLLPHLTFLSQPLGFFPILKSLPRIDFSTSPPLLGDFFSLLLVRVYFAQQLPHRAVLQFELRLRGNAVSDRENHCEVAD